MVSCRENAILSEFSCAGLRSRPKRRQNGVMERRKYWRGLKRSSWERRPSPKHGFKVKSVRMSSKWAGTAIIPIALYLETFPPLDYASLLTFWLPSSVFTSSEFSTTFQPFRLLFKFSLAPHSLPRPLKSCRL